MTTKTERTYIGDIIRMEMPNFQSRKLATIAASLALSAGALLAPAGAGSADVTAFSINAANTGTIASVTVGTGAVTGDYRVLMIEPASNAGAFVVEDPSGVQIGTGNVAAEFSAGGLTFTVTDGATDFKSGEGFVISVTASETLAPTTGPATAILLQDIDTTDGAAQALVLYRDAQVDITSLVYHDDIDVDEDEEEQALIRSGLEKAGITFLTAA